MILVAGGKFTLFVPDEDLRVSLARLKPCTNTVTSQHMVNNTSCSFSAPSHSRGRVCHPHLSWHLLREQHTLASADKGGVLQREAWEAAPISCRAAIELFGADNAHPMSQVTPQIPQIPPAASSPVSHMLQLNSTLAVYCNHHPHGPYQ